MKRLSFLVGGFVLVLCATAFAQVETVVVTASFVGPKAEKLFRMTYARLTPKGKSFVEQQAEDIYNNQEEASAAHENAAYNCTAALGNCSDSDVSALTVLILTRALSSHMLDDMRYMKSFTKTQQEGTVQHIKACGNDKVCALEALLSSLPPDRRHAVEKMIARDRKIRKALNETLTSIGLDPKDDK